MKNMVKIVPITCLIALVSILILWSFNGYLAADLTFITGLLLLPFVMILQPKQGFSYRFLLVSLIIMILSWYLPARTLHFFTLIFIAFFIIENNWGRVNALPVLMTLTISTLVKNWILVFGFPIRLQLSQWAAKSLSLVGFNASAVGNLITLNGSEFSVDEACLGLTMVEVSFIFYWVILALYERKHKRTIPLLYVFTGAGLVLILNVFYNLLRIILLTMFKWMPNTIMHDIGGLVGLALYVFIPIILIVKLMNKKAGKKILILKDKPVFDPSQLRGYVLQMTLSLSFVAGIFWIHFTQTKRTIEKPQEQYSMLSMPQITKSIYKKTNLEHGIVQYKNDSFLIYLKPIRGFFSSEHTPLICWRGSGWQFSETNEILLKNGKMCFIGKLTKDDATLHTAWWYDNGQCKTNSQFRWRWLDFTGAKPFFLVNITAEDPNQLKGEIENLLQ